MYICRITILKRHWMEEDMLESRCEEACRIRERNSRLRLILTCNSIVEIAVNDMGVKKVHKMLSLLSNKLELAFFAI